MKTIAAVLFCFAAVVHAQTYDPLDGSYYLNAETQKTCADNGGCALVTNRWLKQMRADLAEIRARVKEASVEMERLRAEADGKCRPMKPVYLTEKERP